jgi:hypothetical protein
MSADERDASIRELSSQGLPVRAIARELGVSKSTVGRVLVAEPEPADTDTDPWTDEPDADTLALFDADDQREPEPVPPFVFVGMDERVPVSLPGCDEAPLMNNPRFVDAGGRSVSVLDIYRADYADGSSVGHGYLAGRRHAASRGRRLAEGRRPRPPRPSSCGCWTGVIQ